MIAVLNTGSDLKPRWRVLVDAVEVGWATDPAAGVNPLADELRSDEAKAIAIRDFVRETARAHHEAKAMTARCVSCPDCFAALVRELDD